MLKRITIPISLAIASALALPGVASADMRVFKVTAEGSATYSRYDDSRQPGVPIGYVQDINGSMSWRITIPSVVFRGDGTLIDSGYTSGSGSARGSVTASTVSYGMDGGSPVQLPGSCVAAEQEQALGPLMRFESDAAAGGEPGAHVAFTPFTGVLFSASCDGSMAGLTEIGIGSDPRHPPTAFLHRFFLPKEATDQQKIIQHVEQAPGPCPGIDLFTKSCKLTWSGKLTFDLVQVIDTDAPPPPEDELVVDLGKGGERVPDEDSLVVPLRPKLAPNGSRASIGLRCLVACKGAVRAFAVAPRASRKPRPIAVRRFSAPAGRAKTVTLRFRGASRRKVRRAGAVRLVVTVGETRRSLVARIPAQRRGRG